MPVHLDDPVPGVALDPAGFPVRGWVWLEERQCALAAVVATSGDVLLGQADVSTFQERADVSIKYRLPPGTRTAFTFTARHPHASAGTRFDLELRIRLPDGSLTEPIFIRKGALPPLENDPARMLGEHLTPGACGLEIGAHTLPVPGLEPFYTDMVAVYAGSAGRVDFLADARALPLADHTLDYLCSSHVLEHLADPIAALHEWHRVLRPGGLLYLVVPDRRFTFDEPRALTSIEHLLRDFREGATTAANLPHVDEFVFHTDWSRLHPAITRSEECAHQRDMVRERYLRDLEEGKSIDIHYHTFTPESLHGVLQAAGFIGGDTPSFNVLARAERYPAGRDDGIGLLLRKTGSPVRPRVPLETFTLSHSRSRPATTLPLVCPISLDTLRSGTAADGTPVLIATDSGFTYPFQSGLPSLLPPSGAKPLRPWGARSWPDAPTVLNSESAGPSSFTLMRSHLDEPTPAAIIDPLSFLVRGWLWLDAQHPAIAAVEVWSGDLLIGETSALYDRADVVAALSLPAGIRNGFEVFAHHPRASAGGPLDVSVRARLTDGSRTPDLAHLSATAMARDYRQNHFGILLDKHTTAIQRHPNIFATGPSQAEGSGELADLVRRYLGPPPHGRIIDVGCGLGSYGRGLLADGYDWFGVEIDPADCAELKRLGLPHQQVDGVTLPFADGAFASALCLEVLEHIEEPHAFLREVKRVAPRQLIVSVPNCELLGYLWDHLATPWHMLESTHVNYFTRWSLGALLREYYPQNELRFHTPNPLQTIERTPLHYNLLAIARAAS
jgi:SAM-dependent methyltransferase